MNSHISEKLAGKKEKKRPSFRRAFLVTDQLAGCLPVFHVRFHLVDGCADQLAAFIFVCVQVVIFTGHQGDRTFTDLLEHFINIFRLSQELLDDLIGVFYAVITVNDDLVFVIQIFQVLENTAGPVMSRQCRIPGERQISTAFQFSRTAGSLWTEGASAGTARTRRSAHGARRTGLPRPSQTA